MAKRAFIIHGWDGYPEECWFPWLKEELEKRNFQVVVPQLPEPSKPRIETWVSALATTVGAVDADTYFVGHSTGCAAILHFLEQRPAPAIVGGVVLVGPWLTTLKTLKEEVLEDQQVATSWLTNPPHWDRVRGMMKHCVGIFSDNDPYVDLHDADVMREKLGATIVIEHSLGHMGPDVDCLKLPSVLRAVLDISHS